MFTTEKRVTQDRDVFYQVEQCDECGAEVLMFVADHWPPNQDCAIDMLDYIGYCGECRRFLERESLIHAADFERRYRRPIDTAKSDAGRKLSFQRLVWRVYGRY